MAAAFRDCDLNNVNRAVRVLSSIIPGDSGCCDEFVFPEGDKFPPLGKIAARTPTVSEFTALSKQQHTATTSTLASLLCSINSACLPLISALAQQHRRCCHRASCARSFRALTNTQAPLA